MMKEWHVLQDWYCLILIDNKKEGGSTGVLPRNMYRFGAEWYGTDISENQIKYAKILSEKQGMNIRCQTVAVF